MFAGPERRAEAIGSPAVFDPDDEDLPDAVAERRVAIERQRSVLSRVQLERQTSLAQAAVEQEPLELRRCWILGAVAGLDVRRVDLASMVPQGVAAGCRQRDLTVDGRRGNHFGLPADPPAAQAIGSLRILSEAGD